MVNIRMRDEFCIEEKPPPCSVIIFGASGDLTHRKLIPALYNLHRRHLLPERFFVVGCARSSLNDDTFRKGACRAIAEKCDQAVPTEVEKFTKAFYYVQGDYAEDEVYINLRERLAVLDRDCGTGGNHIFYLATPPDLYGTITQRLGVSGLARECEGGPCARVVVEKPFGRDLETARALDLTLHDILGEQQIYRIDHYLGKETVQNILMFRFANSIFEPIWSHEYIDHVQITVAESLGVEHRAGYYDQAGALRDMFQNHMLQMMSLVAMEPPALFEADPVRDEKVMLMQAIEPFDLDSWHKWLVRGQYTAGHIGGVEVPGYRDEEGIGGKSCTETFVAAKFLVNNGRWRGVPFYLRSGKRLAKRVSEIVIVFKRPHRLIFKPFASEDLEPNMLVLNVQPDEGMSLTIQAKHPGPKLCMSALTMDFKYREVFGGDLPDAYERLLLDCMLGDQMLFNRSDAMELAWSLITPLVEKWASEQLPATLPLYPAGSWGPKESDDLLLRDGRRWKTTN